jgi:hypothetical protein
MGQIQELIIRLSRRMQHGHQHLFLAQTALTALSPHNLHESGEVVSSQLLAGERCIKKALPTRTMIEDFHNNTRG